MLTGNTLKNPIVGFDKNDLDVPTEPENRIEIPQAAVFYIEKK